MRSLSVRPLLTVITPFVLGLAMSSAWAEVSVTGAWARASVPAQKASGAFMQIVSTEDARLIAVSTPAAGVAEIHQMSMEGGMMKMSPIDALALPAGKPVELRPGSYHVMLMRLTQTLTPGSEIPLVLTIETASGKREAIDLKVPVKPLDYMPGGAMMKH